MKLPRLLLLGLAFLASAALALAQYPLPNGARVLFIGNSLTGQANGGLPAYVNAAFATGNTGIEMKWHRIQIWNQTLKTHWNNTGSQTKASTAAGVGIYAGKSITQTHARMLIEGGHPDGQPWDYVVLQGYGEDAEVNSIAANGTLSGDFFIFANNFVTLARAEGAIPLLYQRVPNNPAQVAQSAYDTQYANIVANNASLAAHLDLLVVPVAEVNHALTTNPPSGQTTGWLYSDNIHPSDYGLAVQMYTFASMLGKKSYQNIPVTFGKYTTPTAALDLAIRNAVWDEVQSFVDGGTPTNAAPVADAGIDQIVTDSDNNGTQAVTLAGSGTDPDGSITAYAWSWANGGSATGATPTVTLPVGTTVLTLTVTDNGSPAKTDTDTVSITVNAGGGGPGTPIVYEAENLTHTQSDTVTTSSETAASGGKNDVLAANAVGDYVEYSVNVTTADTYQVVVRYKAMSTRGIAQLRIGTDNLGSPVDQRGTGYKSIDLGSRYLTAGTHLFRFSVTGTTGTGFTLSVDSITLTGTGTEPPPPLTTVTFEAEALDFTTSDTVTAYNETAASAGSYDFLNANAVGDYVEYTATVPAAGTYTVSVRYKAMSSRGITQLKIGPDNQGSPFDQRATGYQTVSLGTKTFTAAGPQTFRFQVTGTSGTGYTLTVDSITLTP